MSSSNSFNICPRCGNSNVMNAKYCSRCGGELKLPEEPIVCHNCRTRNTPMANFCRNCGAELKVGYATKICARCGNEVPADQNVCTCGYMFAQNLYASPIPVRTDGTLDTTGLTATQTGGDSAATKKSKKEQRKLDKQAKREAEKSKVYSHKGGRAFAIVALVLLLVFAYFVIVPACVVRPSFLSDFDVGITSEGYDSIEGNSVPYVATSQYYGADIVYLFVQAIIGGGSFGDAISDIGGTVQAIIAVLVAIFALAVLVHLIVCIVRIIRPRRSKRPNWCFLALAVLTTIVVGLIVLFNTVSVGEGFFAKIADIFKLAEGWYLGYVLYAIPVYFWFFFLYSLIAKARALKEAVVTPSEMDTAATAA